MTAAWPADGCPDFHYRDAPVAYADGRVISLDWNELEWTWEQLGGSLRRLRSLQDRLACNADD